ncbi:MAG: EF-Tu/IF-2/RF-3 family GTPase [Candidatus Brocadiia bacterium]
MGIESSFVGMIDVIGRRAFFFDEDELGAKVSSREVPEEFRDEVEIRRAELVEKVAEFDEVILEKYIDGTEPSEEELIQATRRVTLAFQAVPVLCGSSLRNKGVQPLLDKIVELLPSPLDVPPVKGVDPKTGREETRETDPSEPTAALAFKIIALPTGDLTFLRVYSGSVKPGARLFNPRLTKFERISQVYRMAADQRKAMAECRSGDICAVTGLKLTSTGDTLCNEARKILLEKMAFPETLVSVAIEPETNAERERLEVSLGTISREDPTFKYGYDNETGQLLISGMGELHLEIITHRLIGEYKVRLRSGEPRVSYRETVTEAAQNEGVFESIVGGKPMYGKVLLMVEPNPGVLAPTFDFRFSDPRLTEDLRKAITEGALGAAASGVLASYPSIYLKVHLVGAEFRETETTPAAFAAAASAAYKNTFEAAHPALLEPLMSFEVSTPEDYLGAVINDFGRRRATISHVGSRGTNTQVVKGTVPLSEMFGYATAVRSLSQGRAVYTLEPSTYQRVPEEVAKKILLV